MLYILKRSLNLQVLIIFSLAMILPSLASAAEDQYTTLAQDSEDKCLNILVDAGKVGGNQTFYYNGQQVDVPTDYLSVSDVKIFGDKIGLIAWKSPIGGGTGDVLIDDQNSGSVIGWSGYNPMSLDYQMMLTTDFQLQINGEHVAYLRMVGLGSISPAKAAAGYKGNPILHVIFDGQDLGEIEVGTKLKLNGDFVIFKKFIKNHSHIFANNKDLGIGYYGDFDGKNIALVKENYNLYYNGKKIANVGSWGNIELKNGVLAYDKGPVSSPSVVYKGKNIGKGHSPKIEGKNIAFLRGFQAPVSLVYNKKIFKNLWSVTDSYELSGNHFAFVQETNKNTVSINLDGKLYAEATGEKVQISQKDDCQIQ